MFELSCMSMSNCQVNAAKTFGIRVLKPVVAVSHCHHPIQRPPPHSWRPSLCFHREWRPLQFLATSSLRASRSLSVSQRECKPSWCYDYSEFPFSCCQPLSQAAKEEILRLSPMRMWPARKPALKSLELTTHCM